MSCAKRYCPDGMEKCCTDCMRKEMNYCKTVCEKSKDAESCVSYQADTEIQKRKEKRKRKSRIQTGIAFLMLATIFIFQGIGAYQAWQVGKEAKKAIKESIAPDKYAEEKAAISKEQTKEMKKRLELTRQINKELEKQLKVEQKKELPAATGQLRDPVNTGQNSITV